jgi:hypothetical protein
LIVNRPLSAQLSPKNQPERGEKNDDRSELKREAAAEHSRCHDGRLGGRRFLVISYRLTGFLKLMLLTTNKSQITSDIRY